jgi:very-short-patch-repair endonuclease
VAPTYVNADRDLEVVTRNRVVGGETITESLADDPARQQAFNSWKTRWEAWAEVERPALAAMRVFERLYELHGRIERESEQVELMLGDGRLRWQQAQSVDHPILLQRVELAFDPTGTPEFRINDADRGPELYGSIILDGNTITAGQFDQLRTELDTGGYHPLSLEATSGYLRRLVQTLGPRGEFEESFKNTPIGVDPVLSRDAVLFLRRRLSGYPAAFDRVLIDLETREDLPASLTRVVGVDPPLPPDPVERNDSPWGEPLDVLLSKPANDEQIQIARALERHRAVLVQGPPGTGKSHTIANLIGHLVAHGKKVLVTSHATKALRVLRDQVVETLQPLCVAVLENDLAGRQQMEQAVRGILTRLTHETDDRLGSEVSRLAEERATVNSEITKITTDLRAVREAEYIPIVIGGESISPSDAARWLIANRAGNDWIPGPIDQGAPLPLSKREIFDLYDSNQRISVEEELEVNAGLPHIEQVVTPAQFSEMVEALKHSEPEINRQFWERQPVEADANVLEQFVHALGQMSLDYCHFEPWQQQLVAAGYSGGSEEELWIELARQVGVAAEVWERSRSLLLENEVAITAADPDELRKAVGEIGAHLTANGTIGWFQLLTKPHWKAAIATCQVNGRQPQSVTDFRAITAQLNLDDGRKRLESRWRRQAEPAGMPAFEKAGTSPEPVLREYTAQFENLLSWWRRHWTTLDASFVASGFRWTAFRNRETARSGPAKPFDRDVSILNGPLQEVVLSRLRATRREWAVRRVNELKEALRGKTGLVCTALQASVRDLDSTAYANAFNGFEQLLSKVPVYELRGRLLTQLEPCAGEWAVALRRREGAHALPNPPGDVVVAWQWRQLQQEIDRRAALNESTLTRRLLERRATLRLTTANLIDRRAWLGQLRRTDLRAKQALQGWVDTQRKIGKGTGKRVPALQAKARDLLTEARNAVPVWIMPLARVAESFDATKGRFDVVIVDEASQSDITGLLAWYLGDQVVVVGDHEQVSPMAVGQDVTAMQSLISEYLINIPNSHLYDGTTSIYDLARQSFGGTIALREHFRCVPDIIEFSNQLSYNLEIRPLRDPGSAPRPHVVEYMVQPELGAERTGKKNIAEARAIAALMKAVTETPQYAGKTIGAITLLGDEQADCIQDIAVSLIGAVALEGRRFVAGNSAQFQGDERDVVFLSMVDTPTGSPLTLKQTDAFKQRYNVAASRAKDQLWLVHSLDPSRDLKSGDLRRTLIEYMRAPDARRKAVRQASLRAESPFELAVIERLCAAGYKVDPQVVVGRYRIDMIVSDGVNRVALECDGDRFHGIDQIPSDMARQAILERAGWRFLRVRGTRFFRDPEGTMRWVIEELHRLGVDPQAMSDVGPTLDDAASEFRADVVRRAWEIMKEQGWVENPTIADLMSDLQTDLLET